MNEITFNDVDSGDSIILQFSQDQQCKIGLIDFGLKYIYPKSKRVSTRTKFNAILNFIVSRKISEIEFLVVTHPHKDHYSGLLEVLEYCELHNIIIRKFLNPFYPLDESIHLRSKFIDVKVPEANLKYNTSELFELLQQMQSLYKKSIILEMDPIPVNRILHVNDDISIQVISPSHNELVKFQEGNRNYPSFPRVHNSGDLMNLLSMIHLIKFKKTVILLTADAPFTALERSLNEMRECYGCDNLLIQVPHHGSGLSNYFNPKLWDRFNGHNKIAVFSNGINSNYKHPHKNILSHFLGLGFNIYTTNHTHGVVDVFGSVETKNTCGSHSFSFDGTTISKIG